MLIPIETLAIFIPTALALNMTPGNDMLFCLGQGIKSGPRAGNAASLGIATGAMIHTLLAGLGLAALVAAHPVALEILRWLGIAYLVWLAINAFRSSDQNLAPARTKQSSAFRAWRDAPEIRTLPRRKPSVPAPFAHGGMGLWLICSTRKSSCLYWPSSRNLSMRRGGRCWCSF